MLTSRNLQSICATAVGAVTVLFAAATLSGNILSTGAVASGIGTNNRDFIQPGTQPDPVPPGLTEPIETAAVCKQCHAGFDTATEPGTLWSASMMGQSARNPMFWATVAIANQDAGNGGYLCMRCHIPVGWLGGRTTVISDGSILDESLHDFEGVTCNFCHRLVDPVYDPLENPSEDLAVLPTGQYEVSVEPHGGMYILDLLDRRRGPRELATTFPHHAWLESPYHKESLLCATCHDVSNPVFMRASDGSYVTTAMVTEHPTHEKTDEFPLERTFSEWALSDFAVEAIDMGGRFGGTQAEISTCQDCHMPKVAGTSALPALGAEVRPDIATHGFNGSSTWALRAIHSLNPRSKTGLTDASVAAAEARSLAMHQNAADLYAWERNGELVVRIVNQTGHKLPTGFLEGRRMWLHLRFLDESQQLLAEHGSYDSLTADLDESTTLVIEGHQGISAEVSLITGLPTGPSFHMMANSTIEFDNRIPPRGFDNAAFAQIDAEPVGATYRDQHYWIDEAFTLPAGTARVEVELYFQSTSKAFIEFLRDANHTNADGQIAYDAWVAQGQSAPVLMTSTAIDVAVDGGCPEPIPYGVGKVGSTGERPYLRKLGFPRVSTANFRIQIKDGTPNQFGVLFGSPNPGNAPFHGGRLYMSAPLMREGIFNLNGNGDAVVSIPVDATMIGNERYYQAFYRDPGSPDPVGVTAALHVDFCP